MVSKHRETEVGLLVGDPEYWELLSRSLHNAKELLWKRLQHGDYRDDNEARAVMDAYWALKKVVELQEKKIRQIPLPQTVEDEYPPARLGLMPQEVPDDTRA